MSAQNGKAPAANTSAAKMSNGPLPQLYRSGTLGTTLIDAIDDFIVEGGLTPQDAAKLLEAFDKAMYQKMPPLISHDHELKMQGHLETYGFCDEVWRFKITDFTMTFPSGEMIPMDKLHILCMPYMGPPDPKRKRKYLKPGEIRSIPGPGPRKERVSGLRSSHDMVRETGEENKADGLRRPC
ncbi:hypothetical protein VTI74DRAFT_3753 [Chaetomium olivicolor]